MDTRGEVEEELMIYFKGIMTEYKKDRDQDIAQITTLIPRKVTERIMRCLIIPSPCRR